MFKLLKSPLTIYIAIVTLTSMSLLLLFVIDNQTIQFNSTNILSLNSKNMSNQATWFIVSFFACLIIHFIINKKWIIGAAELFYAFNIILLIITLFVANNVRGSQSWISFGGLNFQPAEFSKIFVLLFLASFTSQKKNLNNLYNKSIILGAVLLPSLIIVGQKEVGQVLLYLGLFIPLYLRGFSLFYLYFILSIMLSTYLVLLLGLSTVDTFFTIILAFTTVYHIFYKKKLYKNIIRYTQLGIAFLLVFLTYHFAIPIGINHFMKPHHIRRIISMIHTEPNTQDWMSEKTKNIVLDMNMRAIKYNVKQAEIAMGSGRFLGKGMDNSTQTRFSFIPEQHTDFIFSAVGEVWGLVGMLLIFMLYLFVLYRLLYFGARATNNFDQFIITGVFAYLLINVTINVGMVLGTLPVVGLPLPWLSYGGSSFLANSIMIAIAIKVALYPSTKNII